MSPKRFNGTVISRLASSFLALQVGLFTILWDGNWIEGLPNCPTSGKGNLRRGREPGVPRLGLLGQVVRARDQVLGVGVGFVLERSDSVRRF